MKGAYDPNCSDKAEPALNSIARALKSFSDCYSAFLGSRMNRMTHSNCTKDIPRRQTQG